MSKIGGGLVIANIEQLVKELTELYKKLSGYKLLPETETNVQLVCC